jgi:hydroxymethylglutaryl-CoA lyase/(R)-citramalyl-CoA lyase
MATRVQLCDVGPRDGLQNDELVLDPAVRVEMVERLAATGLPRVEAASFVHPGRVPQMAGAEDVFAGIERRAGTRYAGLVLNERGLDRALAAGVDVVNASYAGLVLNERGLDRALAAGVDVVNASYAVTDGFARANQNSTAEGAATAAERIVARARDAGVPVAVTLSVAFGCPFDGEVDPGLVLHHVGRMAAAGADELLLADTIGVAVPAQVRRLVPAAVDAMGGRPVGLHLHNTRNTGYANADAGIEAGATLLDASVGGLGGCPFAPGATGNIATEDLVYLLERSGIETGVDLDAVIGVARWLGAVVGRELPGLLHRAGPFRPASHAGARA